MKIKIHDDFDFEFLNNPCVHTQPKQEFLGQEYLTGKLIHPGLNSLFPDLSITLFGVIPTRFDQTVAMQNLSKNSFFTQFDDILIDWPQEFFPHLFKIKDSFPHPLCLTDKGIFEKGELEKNSLDTQKKEIYFIESYCVRRQIVHYAHSAKLHCVGGNHTALQAQQTQESPYQLTQGLLPWLCSQFVCSQEEAAQENHEAVCRKILEQLTSLNDKKILLVVSFEIFQSLNFILKKIENKNDLNNYIHTKVIGFKKPHTPSPLFLSQPTKTTCLDFSKLDGFVSRKLYEQENTAVVQNSWLENYHSILSNLFKLVQEKYTQWTKISVSPAEERDFFKFAYRLARHSNLFFPSSFDWLVAGKGVINANFAYELHKEFEIFPVHTHYEHSLKPIDIPLTSLYEKVQRLSVQKFATLQSQSKIKKIKLHALNKQTLSKSESTVCEEKYADNQWVHEDHPYSCSFPSEDIFMEKLAADCKKNWQERVKEKEVTFKELLTDFGDGLDIRETIRNWHNGKLVVKDTAQSGKADIGTVVFNFTDSQDDDKFSWKAFWLAEQHDDSHLMFYATPFKDNLIGPGIAKSEFGGFAVIPIDSYLEHPWHHPYILSQARSATDCLILAGALSNAHKTLLFISHHPPSAHIIKILKHSGKHLLYAKLDEFPKDAIRHVKTFHILAESGVRDYAAKYIRKDDQ